MRKYLAVWLTTTTLSVETALENRKAAVFFLAGKFMRFFLYLFFLYFIGSRVAVIGGYDLNQMINFYLVFNLLDLFGQIFFRGIYWFRQQIITGEFDFKLAKPVNSLFQVLTRETDILDLPLLLMVIVMLVIINFGVPIFQVGLFLVMILIGVIIITAVHILVASLGVITTEVDHTIMIFRDVSAMARFPVDIYAPAIRSLLTFVLPVAIAYTFPAKALMGLLTPGLIIFSLFGALVVWWLSLRLWRYALTQYTSASS